MTALGCQPANARQQMRVRQVLYSLSKQLTGTQSSGHSHKTDASQGPTQLKACNLTQESQWAQSQGEHRKGDLTPYFLASVPLNLFPCLSLHLQWLTRESDAKSVKLSAWETTRTCMRMKCKSHSTQDHFTLLGAAGQKMRPVQVSRRRPTRGFLWSWDNKLQKVFLFVCFFG